MEMLINQIPNIKPKFQYSKIKWDSDDTIHNIEFWLTDDGRPFPSLYFEYALYNVPTGLIYTNKINCGVQCLRKGTSI